MNILTNLSKSSLTQTAIAALKNAYEKCNDEAAREAIIVACKAITVLHYNVDTVSEDDSSLDPSEFCAAV